MKNKKLNSYLFSGLLLIYFGLKDGENFNPIYHGTVLAAGTIAFVMAFNEYRKSKSENS